MTLQLPLLEPPAFAPLPLGSGHYVAAVQNKSGELAALRHLSGETWKAFTPLVALLGRLEQPKEYRADTVAGWMRRLSDAVGEHPLFLDLLRLKPEHAVRIGDATVPLLERVYWAARRRLIAFVPVAWVGESTAVHLRLVREAVERDHRGVALRYRIRGLAIPMAQQREYLSRMLLATGTTVENADLIIDLDYIDPDVEIHADDLAAAVGSAMQVGDWRSVVLLGTSMPSMLSCVREGTVGTLPRREWELWQALTSRGLRRLPSYGDYAIQHSRPPDGGGPSMRANIRYTSENITIVARGQGSVLQAGREQYVTLCRQLVALDTFAGGNYSWGDSIIEDCAKERMEPGAQNMWRGAGTSHHVQFVTDQLRKGAVAA